MVLSGNCRAGDTMVPCMGKIPKIQVVLLSFSIAISFLFRFCNCNKPGYLNNYCSNSTIYASNSTYQSNLNTLLSSLSSYATSNSNNAYRNATVGQGSNTVYGLYYCRGDVKSDMCSSCVNTAASYILQLCPNQKVAYIWYDQCTLRYSNDFFYSTIFDWPFFFLANGENITNPTWFNQLLADTMNQVASAAASDSKRFADKEVPFTSLQNLYCLVQCSPDLSENNCKTCLAGNINYLPVCCSGKVGGRAYNPSCNVRFEVYPFYQNYSNGISGEPYSNRGASKTWEIVAIVVSVAVAGVTLLSLFLHCVLIRKKKNQDPSEENGGNTIESTESLQFDFNKVLAATNNFADDNKIGEGGFGGVFKGKLPNGQEIAVRRLSRNSGQGGEEFKNEVALVAKLQHRNLVRLLGYCSEGEEKILIYEFVPNKSLDYYLFDPEQNMELDWRRRYKIIGGIARGLLYLHEDSFLRIIHRDLKTSNVLLDGEMNPKISDFRVARIFGVDQTQANTNRIFGTNDYMSPEYAMHGHFSVKSDVFGFGVLVLEILSGKKSNSFCEGDHSQDLISYVWKHWNAGTAFELIDPIMREKCSRGEVMRCIHIALLCVQKDAADRPTMASVIHMLNSYSGTLPLLSQRAFLVRSRMESSIVIEGNENQEAELD